jgi:hypothetical protein
VYGKYIASLKGKTVRKTPKPSALDHIETPPEILDSNKYITLLGDVFFVNKILFIVTLSQHVIFTTVEHIARRTKIILMQSLIKVKHVYENQSFGNTAARMDNEFEPLRTDIKKEKIDLDCPGAGDHVPDIERRIRVIKERARACRKK